MNYVIACMYAIFSIIVMVGMTYFTNRKIINDEENKISPYRYTGILIVMVVFVTILTGFCGYKIGKQASSIFVVIKMGCCLTATLGAAVIDYKLKIIPNFIPLSLTGLRVIFLIYELLFTDTAMAFLLASIIGCLSSFLFLGLANKISKGGIGGGDIKLLSAIGFMSDLYIVLKTLLLSLIICIVLTAMLLMLKKQTIKGHLPFAPFIFGGFVGMCLFAL